jgi:hypothetical protein
MGPESGTLPSKPVQPIPEKVTPLNPVFSLEKDEWGNPIPDQSEIELVEIEQEIKSAKRYSTETEEGVRKVGAFWKFLDDYRAEVRRTYPNNPAWWPCFGPYGCMLHLPLKRKEGPIEECNQKGESRVDGISEEKRKSGPEEIQLEESFTDEKIGQSCIQDNQAVETHTLQGSDGQLRKPTELFGVALGTTR